MRKYAVVVLALTTSLTILPTLCSEGHALPADMSSKILDSKKLQPLETYVGTMAAPFNDDALATIKSERQSPNHALTESFFIAANALSHGQADAAIDGFSRIIEQIHGKKPNVSEFEESVLQQAQSYNALAYVTKKDYTEGLKLFSKSVAADLFGDDTIKLFSDLTGMEYCFLGLGRTDSRVIAKIRLLLLEDKETRKLSAKTKEQK